MSEREYNRFFGVMRLAGLFAVILVLIYFARPTVTSVGIGFIFVVLGETVRFWSSGLLLKTRELMTAGPYRYVRHPGYVGYVAAMWGTALCLGSLWALIPAGVGSAAFVVRTALEDRRLHEELAGYAAYAARVRYRLLPGVW